METLNPILETYYEYVPKRVTTTPEKTARNKMNKLAKRPTVFLVHDSKEKGTLIKYAKGTRTAERRKERFIRKGKI